MRSTLTEGKRVYMDTNKHQHEYRTVESGHQTTLPSAPRQHASRATSNKVRLQKGKKDT